METVGGEETEKLGENEAGGLKWQPKAGTSLFRVTLQRGRARCRDRTGLLVVGVGVKVVSLG